MPRWRANRTGPARAERRTAEGFGRRAEILAAWSLRLKLYRIVASRVKTPVGEIDLIASRFGVTVFIEVKARAGQRAEAEALAAVNQRRIIRAAQYWLTRHPDRAAAPLRFDVIFLAPGHWPRHFPDAFRA